jgi:hypothetical protein
MNVTSYSFESAQSAIAANLTAGLSRTRSPLKWGLSAKRCFWPNTPAWPAGKVT